MQTDIRTDLDLQAAHGQHAPAPVRRGLPAGRRRQVHVHRMRQEPQEPGEIRAALHGPRRPRSRMQQVPQSFRIEIHLEDAQEDTQSQTPLRLLHQIVRHPGGAADAHIQDPLRVYMRPLLIHGQ